MCITMRLPLFSFSENYLIFFQRTGHWRQNLYRSASPVHSPYAWRNCTSRQAESPGNPPSLWLPALQSQCPRGTSQPSEWSWPHEARGHSKPHNCQVGAPRPWLLWYLEPSVSLQWVQRSPVGVGSCPDTGCCSPDIHWASSPSAPGIRAAFAFGELNDMGLGKEIAWWTKNRTGWEKSPDREPWFVRGCFPSLSVSSVRGLPSQPVILHSLSARTKKTNKRIHLNVPQIDTIVYRATERGTKMRR